MPILLAVAGVRAGGDTVLAALASRPGKTFAARQAAPVALPPGLDIPSYRPGPMPFKDGQILMYEASWIGIPAAQARIVLRHDPTRRGRWTGELWINTSPAVDIVYRMRDYFREDFLDGSFLPEDMYLLQHEKKRVDQWKVEFNRSEHLVTSVKHSRQGRITTRRFSGGDPWGPFSGAMMALSQPLKAGARYTFDVFSGGSRYVFAFNVVRRERIDTALGPMDALRIEPSVIYLSNGDFRNQARDSTIWVAADPPHVPLKMQSAVFIGNMNADLIEMGMIGRPAKAAPASRPAAPAVTAPAPADQ